jgi:hypothetical protein
MVNSYLSWVNAEEARAGMEGIDGKTGYGYSNARGGIMVHSMGVSRGNCNDY